MRRSGLMEKRDLACRWCVVLGEIFSPSEKKSSSRRSLTSSYVLDTILRPYMLGWPRGIPVAKRRVFLSGLLLAACTRSDRPQRSPSYSRAEFIFVRLKKRVEDFSVWMMMICLAVGRTIFYALPVRGRMRYTGKKEEIKISAGRGGETDDLFGDDRRCASWIRIMHAIKPGKNKT